MGDLQGADLIRTSIVHHQLYAALFRCGSFLQSDGSPLRLHAQKWPKSMN